MGTSRKKSYRKRSRHKIKVISILITSIFICSGFFIEQIFDSVAEKTKQREDIYLVNSDTNKVVNPLLFNDLYSSNGILINLETDQVIAEKHISEKIYPASITKIMTAILAIENTIDMNETFEIPADIFHQLYEQNASMAGFAPNEIVTMEDLLYGLMLPSGAECSLTIEQVVSDSKKSFVELMNLKAKEIGMHNTNYTNSTGLHDNNHYSTVSDISILLEYALQNDMFRKIFTTSRYTITPTTQHPEGFTVHSTMFKRMESTEVNSGNIIGGKTGYTEESGLCLASVALIDEEEYMLITVNADGSPSTEPFHILDAFVAYNTIK